MELTSFVTTWTIFSHEVLVCGNNLLQLCSDLGSPLHSDKLERQATSLTILGINPDSISSLRKMGVHHCLAALMVIKAFLQKKRNWKLSSGFCPVHAKLLPRGIYFWVRWLISYVHIPATHTIIQSGWIKIFGWTWHGGRSFFTPRMTSVFLTLAWAPLPDF